MMKLTTTKEKLDRVSRLAGLIEKRDAYVERLNTGAAKIEEARDQGQDVSLWEDYWIQLLHRYEAVCDTIRELQGVSKEQQAAEDASRKEEDRI
jgi:hypothetical protein